MITLVQLPVGIDLNFWINYRPGIYYYNFDGNYPLVASDFLTNVPTGPTVTDIGAVSSDGQSLTKVTSITDLDNGPSFYFNESTKMLYIRLQNYDPPSAHLLNVGPIYGFANQTYTDPGTGTEYESRLISSFGITREKDPLFFGDVQYNDFEVELRNADYFLYDVQNWDVYGQPLTVLIGDENQAVSSFHTILTGKVKEYIFEGDSLIIRVEDTRRILDYKLPRNTVNTTDYTDASRDDGKYIPIVYGECRGVPCRVLDDDKSIPTFFTFACADVVDHSNGIKSIDKVYVENVVITPASTNLTAGTFTIAVADYEAGQTVTADIKGYVDGSSNLIENPLDIVKDMLTTYITDVEFNNNYFSVGAWNNATSGKTDVNYCIYKQTKIADIVEKIASSFLEGLTITPDNKFSWLVRSDANAPIYQVKDIDWKAIPSVEFSSDEAISSASVQYAEFYNEGTPKTVINSDNFDAFFQKFKTNKDQIFETQLTNDSDAIAWAAYLAETYQDVQVFITGTIDIKLSNPDVLVSALDLQPGQNIDIEMNGLEIRGGKIQRTDFVGRVKAELIYINIDGDAEEAEIKARVIEPYDLIYVDSIPIGDFIIGTDYISVAGNITNPPDADITIVTLLDTETTDGLIKQTTDGLDKQVVE